MENDLKDDFKYNQNNIHQFQNVLFKDQYNDPYLVNSEYTHNFKIIKFSRNNLCMLKSCIPTPTGIKHIVLPSGSVFNLLKKLKQLTEEEYKLLSYYFMGIIEQKLYQKYKYDAPMASKKLEAAKQRINTIAYEKNLISFDRPNILKYILVAQQADRNESPIKEYSLNMSQAKEWDSLMPKWIYQEYRESTKKLKRKIHAEISSDIEQEKFNELNELLQATDDISEYLYKNLENLKKDNYQSFQILLKVCPYLRNENLNSVIEQIPMFRKYLFLYVFHNIVQQIPHQGSTKKFTYILKTEARNTILSLTKCSIAKKKNKPRSASVSPVLNHKSGLVSPRSLLQDDLETDLTPRTKKEYDKQIDSIDKKKKRRSSDRPVYNKKHNIKRLSRSSSPQKNRRNNNTKNKSLTKPAPISKKRIQITRLSLPFSPRKRSNSIGDPVGVEREKITTKNRSNTDGDLSARACSILENFKILEDKSCDKSED